MQRYRDKKIRVCDKNSIPLFVISHRTPVQGMFIAGEIEDIYHKKNKFINVT